MLNGICLKHGRVQSRKVLMPVHRKRFRIEEAIGDIIQLPEGGDVDTGPMHNEIMAELRAIRAQMANGGKSAAMSALEGSADREVAEASALLETYRAQIEQ